jgi:hypothetical protein
MKDWVQLQRDLYRDIRNEVDLLLQRQPKALQRYESEFLKDQQNLVVASSKEFIMCLNQTDTVFFGDFHTLRQSQRLVLRLLRDRKIKKPKFLALEVVNPSHEKLIEQWLKRPSPKTELQVQNGLELEKRFGCSWETFREIFLECKKNKVEIKGLFHSSTSLHKRDQIASRRLALLNERTWVLSGEYHCARPHLPKKLKQLSPLRSLAVVQQNDDRAGLKYLGHLSSEKTLILKSPSKDKTPLFCLLHTPLWVKWQSYLDRYLLTTDRSQERETQLDLRDQIIWSLQTLLQFLNDPRYPFRKKESDLLDFEIYGPDDPEFSRSFSRLPSRERQSALRQLRSSNTAILPSRRKIYLAEQTVNSCSQAAGLYLFQMQSGILPQSEDFYKSVLVEAMAFFMSKLLNHSRQALHWKDLQLLARRKNARQRESKAILKCQSFSQFGLSSHWRKALRPYQPHAIVALGRMLGDSVFEAFLSGEFSRSRLIRLVSSSVKTEMEAFERVVELQSIARDFNPRRSRIW